MSCSPGTVSAKGVLPRHWFKDRGGGDESSGHSQHGVCLQLFFLLTFPLLTFLPHPFFHSLLSCLPPHQSFRYFVSSCHLAVLRNQVGRDTDHSSILVPLFMNTWPLHDVDGITAPHLMKCTVYLSDIHPKITLNGIRF